ncbi:hypothetical protein BH23GEM3_BH23GEM3_04400 [soil metagenome]
MPQPTPFLPAQAVVTEGDWTSWVSRAIRRVTGSKWTHTFLVTGPDELIEAWFPRVRTRTLSERTAELARDGRDYVVLELPETTDAERHAVVNKAKEYVGRFYDVGQVLLYYTLRRFWKDGEGTLICSRLVTAAHFSGLGPERGNLFPPEVLAAVPPRLEARMDNLKAGYATPDDLLYSRLVRIRTEVVETVPLGV